MADAQKPAENRSPRAPAPAAPATTSRAEAAPSWTAITIAWPIQWRSALSISPSILRRSSAISRTCRLFAGREAPHHHDRLTDRRATSPEPRRPRAVRERETPLSRVPFRLPRSTSCARPSSSTDLPACSRDAEVLRKAHPAQGPRGPEAPRRSAAGGECRRGAPLHHEQVRGRPRRPRAAPRSRSGQAAGRRCLARHPLADPTLSLRRQGAQGSGSARNPARNPAQNRAPRRPGSPPTQPGHCRAIRCSGRPPAMRDSRSASRLGARARSAPSTRRGIASGGRASH